MSIEVYRQDPIRFVRDFLRDPETGRPFQLFPAEERFLREAFTLTADGRLPYPELLFSGPKKTGKTTLAAMALLYVVLVLGGRYAEGYCVANDEEQARGRVFEAVCRMIRAVPALRKVAKISQAKVEFPMSGATITALASDYAGAAGAAPSITTFDELWAYSSERFVRLWDEMIPVPTRPVSVRLTCTYAGFSGESKLLEGLYQRGLHGEEMAPDLYAQPGLLMFWTHDFVAPWQTEEWREQMREQLRPMAFRRMILNEWVSGEEQFVPVDWWDRAATAQPLVADRAISVVLGVDAGLKRDSAAVVACAWDGGKVRVVAHRVFTPTGGESLDLEDTLEEAVRDFAQRFRVKEVRYDPWQFARSAQTLAKGGINMQEFPQSLPNLTAMSTNLYELFKGGNLIAYPDEAIRLAVQRAVAVESSRGLKLAKEKASHKIDVLVALAIAALGAVQKPPVEPVAVAPVSLTRSSPWHSMGTARSWGVTAEGYEISPREW